MCLAHSLSLSLPLSLSIYIYIYIYIPPCATLRESRATRCAHGLARRASRREARCSTLYISKHPVKALCAPSKHFVHIVCPTVMPDASCAVHPPFASRPSNR